MPPSPTKNSQFLIIGIATAAIGAALVAGVILGKRTSIDPDPQQNTTTPAPPTAPTPRPEQTPPKPFAAPPPLPPLPTRTRTTDSPKVVSRPRPPSISTVQRIPDAEELERLERHLTALAKSENNPNRLRELRELGNQLASGVSPDLLPDWLAILQDPRARQEFVRGYLDGLSTIDPEAAANQAADIVANLKDTPGFGINQAMSIILGNWSKSSPEKAAEWIASELPTNSQQRSSAWHAIAQQWAISDPESALAWSTALGKEGSSMTTRIAQILGQKNPEDAIQRVFGMELGPARDAYLAGVATAWVRLDPTTAMEAIGTVADKGKRTSATHQAVVHWAHLDPQAAAAWTTQNADPHLKNSLQQNIARTWSSRDPVAALSWAAQQDDLNLREALISAAAPQAVWRDPDLAIKTVDSLPAGRHRTNAVSRLVSNWAQRNPEKAANFAATSELTAATRHKTVADASYQWARRSPEAASAWISELPADNSRWNAIMGATSGAAKFRDGKIVSQWWTAMRRDSLDAATVRTWLERPEVPASVREQFLPLTE